MNYARPLRTPHADAQRKMCYNFAVQGEGKWTAKNLLLESWWGRTATGPEREDPCVGPCFCWRRWPPPASCARRRRTPARAGSPSCRSTRATPHRSPRTPPRSARRRSSTASPGVARCTPRGRPRRTRRPSTRSSTARPRRASGNSRPSNRGSSYSQPWGTADRPRRRPRPSSAPFRRTTPPRHGGSVPSTASSSPTSRAPAARSTR